MAEYSIAIAFVLAAVIGMQVYAKRAVQAKVKRAVDTLVSVDPTDAGVAGTWPSTWTNIRQYEPYYARSDMTNVRGDKFDETYNKGEVSREGTLALVERYGTDSQSGAQSKIDTDGDGIPDTDVASTSLGADWSKAGTDAIAPND